MVLAQGLTVESATAKHTVGTRYRDETNGKEYIYCVAGEALTQYDFVVITPVTFSAVQLTKTDADKNYDIGVTAIAVTSAYYFWAQVYGDASNLCITGTLADSPVYTSATAGAAGTTATSQTAIQGLVFTVANSSGSTAARACRLTYPKAVVGEVAVDQAQSSATSAGLAASTADSKAVSEATRESTNESSADSESLAMSTSLSIVKSTADSG